MYLHATDKSGTGIPVTVLVRGKTEKLFDDLEKFDRFAQSVEDEVNSELARNGQDND